MVLIGGSKVNTRNDKKNAPAGEGNHQMPKRRKEKLIRLDDLIPKGNVVGGQGSLLFGATDTRQTTNPKQQDN
jgi:hypothetical protein